MLCKQCANFFEIKAGNYANPSDEIALLGTCLVASGVFEELRSRIDQSWLDKEGYMHVVKCTHFTIKSKTH